MVLDQRQDEGGAAVDALGGVAAADLAVDDQDAVAGAALVALDQQQDEAEKHHRYCNDGNADPDGVSASIEGFSWASTRWLDMADPLRLRDGNDFHGVRSDHGNDLDRGAGR